jgi:hypothetical protein
MTEPENANGERLRAMFLDAAAHIHPTRPVPETTATSAPTPRTAPLRLTFGLAVCVAAAVGITFAVHPWGSAGANHSTSGTGGSGALLTVESNGAVDLRAPDTGAILSTLVGPSPVDSRGRHLSDPSAVSAAHQVAYIAYDRPSPVIESCRIAAGLIAVNEILSRSHHDDDLDDSRWGYQPRVQLLF